MRSFFFSFALIALGGCSSLYSSQPLIQRVTAIALNNEKQILWVDQKLNEPQKLTVLKFLNEKEQYQAEYRWQDGQLHEIEQKGQLLIKDEVKSHTLLIRYDESGQAIYQQYKVNNEIFPVKNTQLTNYYQEALQTYDLAVRSLANEKVFFQGVVDNRTMVECGDSEKKMLSVSDPLYKNTIYDNKRYFIAASGISGVVQNTVESVVLLSDANTSCLTRPIF